MNGPTKETSRVREVRNRLTPLLESVPSEKNVDRFLIGTLCFLILVHAIFVIARIHGDAGVFMTIGAGLLEGKLPYVDYIDHKPPGIYFLLAGLFAVGRSALLAKVVVFATNMFTGGLVFWQGKRIAGQRGGLLAVVLFLSSSLTYSGFHVLTEPFVALFGFLAGITFLTGERTSRDYYHLLTGVLVGGAVLFKQPGLTYLAGLLVFIAFLSHSGQIERPVRKSIYILIGTALPISISTLFFYFQDAVKSFLYWSLLVHFVGDTYSVSPLRVVAGNLREISQFPLLWILMLTGIAIVLRRTFVASGTDRELQLFTLLTVFSALPLALRGWGHYYLQLLPFASLVAGFAACEVFVRLKPVLSSFDVRVAILSILLISSIAPLYSIQVTAFDDIVNYNLMDDRRLGTHIESETAADDEILTLGEQAKFYFLSNRQPVNRNLYYLTINEPLYSQDRVIRTIERGDIPYIVVKAPCHAQVTRVCKYVASKYKTDRTSGSVHLYQIPNE